MQIHDMGWKPLGIIKLGNARTSNSYIRVLHKIYTKAIDTAIETVKVLAHENKLKIKIKNLVDSFEKMKPVKTSRKKRWESLGSAWKYMSGSPDAEDLSIINSTTNSLICQNNKQVKINKLFEDRIYNMSRSLTSFVKNMSNAVVDRMNAVNLIFNIDELIKYLEIIDEAIKLARANIPSSRLITSQELQTIRNIISNKHLGLDSPDNMLDIATAYVLYNGEQIVYALKNPKIKATNFEVFYIEPIITNDTKIHIKTNYILKGPNIYTMDQSCPKLKNLYICSYSKLKAADQCLSKHMNGSSAQCTMEKTYG